MEKKKRRGFDRSRFKGTQPKTVSLTEDGELIRMKAWREGSALPLFAEPAVDEVDLADWFESHLDQIRERLYESGAILFRGFGIHSPAILENAASRICPDLFNENGEHPRESVSGKVYTPVFYPPENQLLWHNENSFNHQWPAKMFFACEIPPEQGGETPLVDSRKVYSRVDPRVRDRFEEHGILYMRNYGQGLGLDWQTVFQTDDRAEVESRFLASGIEFEWKDEDGLRTRSVRPAVVEHPVTGEKSWFNQAQHWHISCLEPEVRRSLAASFAEEDLPRNCYYGDGSPIADEDMKAILDIYAELEVFFPWQRGDVVLVDNILAAHGRNPFRGQRKILVAMGEMTSFDELG